jgi:hypothetical protein
MRSPCLIWAECGRPSETGSVSHGRGSKTENRGGALGLMAGGDEASAGERQRGKAGNRLHSELGGRGLYFDRQQEEGLTPGNALWQRAVGRSVSTVAGRRGDHWRWRRGRRGPRGGSKLTDEAAGSEVDRGGLSTTRPPGGRGRTVARRCAPVGAPRSGLRRNVFGQLLWRPQARCAPTRWRRQVLRGGVRRQVQRARPSEMPMAMALREGRKYLASAPGG